MLAAAHAKGVIHRDIKPANLFLTDDGTVKVLDFGIARVRDALSSGSSSTGTGVLLGTPAVMAPEQALSKASEIDGRTDVWAGGATLFTLLSGQLVHDGESASHLLVNAATQRARSLSSLVSGTPLAVAELIDRALAFDKGQRWASAEAMRDAIGGTYAATVGEAISRGPLLGLFQRTNVPLPRAAAHVVVVPPHSGPGAPSAPSAPADLGASVAKQGSALTGASREYATAPTVGMITAQPVSSDTRDVRRRAASRDPSSMLALAAGAIVVAVLATWAVRRNAGEAPARSHADSFSGIAAPDAAQRAAPPASATSLPPIAPAPTTEAPREPIAPAPTPPPTPRDAHRAATPKGTTSSPCALVQTLDKDGEPHFTCPCKTCQ